MHKSKEQQYYEYVNNGGTMSMEEWEKDGRYDPEPKPIHNMGLSFIGSWIHRLESYKKNGANLDIMERIALDLMIQHMHNAYVSLDSTVNTDYSEIGLQFEQAPRIVELERSHLALMLNSLFFASKEGDKIVIAQHPEHITAYKQSGDNNSEILSLPNIY